MKKHHIIVATAVVTSMFFGIAHCVADDDDIITIESSSVDYDGENLVLSDDVVIDHPFGVVMSQHATLFGDKGSNIKVVKLKDDVIISLDGGAELRCHNASINQQTLSAVFSGSSPERRVVFTGSNDDGTPIVMKSMTMNVSFSKDEISSIYFVNNIFSQENVFFTYGDSLTAIGDRAIYHSMKKSTDAGSPRGVIFLTPLKKGGLCRIFNDDIIINAMKIRLDTNGQEILCSHVAGSVVDEDTAATTFKANTVAWDVDDDILSLHGDVFIEQKSLGVLTADDDIYLHKGSSASWDTINGDGTTTWTYTNELDGTISTITCHGTMLLDNVGKKLLFQSPEDTVSNKTQVYYHNSLGEIYADTIAVHYSDDVGSTTPTMMNVTGNVKIISSSSSRDGSSLQRFALADSAEYSIGAEGLLLKADAGRRVLFLDKDNDLQVSAEAVMVHLVEDNDEETISTVGDVRFALNEEEYYDLKQNFNIE